MATFFSIISTRLRAIPFSERPTLTALATSSVLLFPFAVRNYITFLRLKPPSPIANPLGWLFALTLRLLGRETKSTEEYDRPNSETRTWLAEDFPWRKGDRPEIGWFPAPHRQISQWSSPQIHKKLETLLEDIATVNSNKLEIRKSEYERQTNALFVAQRIVTSPPNETCRAAHGEVAHIHDTFDYSLHVVLAPQDCKKVIQHGWGERHPCSGRLKRLPKEYLMIYVPRDDEEFRVIADIVRSGASFMSGEQII